MSEGYFDGFFEDYFAESEDHLAGARRALLDLESSIGDAADEQASIADLFRYFHSLKGISAMVGLGPAEQLAHHLEHYLRAIRQREVAVTPRGIDVLADGIQRLEDVIGAKRAKRAEPDINEIIQRVGELVAETVAVPGSVPDRAGEQAAGNEGRWLCTFVPTRELMARGIGVDAIRLKLSAIGTMIDALPRVGGDGTIAFQFTLATTRGEEALKALESDGLVYEAVKPRPSDIKAAADAESALEAVADRQMTGAQVVRVDLSRLDELMQSVGDLVISRARLVESLAHIERHVPAVEWRAVHDNAIAIDRQLRVLREGIMRVRLVPIGEIFRRMPFVVRDLARESGRAVTIDLYGQSTEIDKYLIERMMDPVVHLVRNAVSHGIEPPVERIAKGKRPEGSIALRASTVGEMVTIEVADDGRGIDQAAVVARARTLGLPVPGDAPDAQTILALICSPGFTTTLEADRVSGRGVGMSVVKSTIEELSGTLTLESSPDNGTRFIIELPLTLAIADALIGRVGAESFAVPQNAVREVIEVSSADVRALEQNEVVPYRGAALPIIRLSRLFAIDEPPSERFHVLVFGTGAAAIGIAVHRVVGHREIVVRTITDPLVKVDGIAGATDLGDGRVVLILDPSVLVRLTRQRAARALEAAGRWGRIRA